MAFDCPGLRKSYGRHLGDNMGDVGVACILYNPINVNFLGCDDVIGYGFGMCV